MHEYLVQELKEHTPVNIPPDRSCIWSFGGFGKGGDRHEASTSINEELMLAFIQINNRMLGIPPYEVLDGFRTVCLPILGVSGRSFLNYVGITECSYWERNHFWEMISKRFIAQSSGILTAAVHNTIGSTIFRRIEFADIMANDAITDVRVLIGEKCEVILFDAIKGTAIPMPLNEAFDLRKQMGKKSFDAQFEFIHRAMTPASELEVLPKVEWARRMKDQWEQNVTANLLKHYEGGLTKFVLGSNEPERNFNVARAQFIMEAVAVSNEVRRLENLANAIPKSEDVKNDLDVERLRKERFRAMFLKFTDILNFDEELSPYEIIALRETDMKKDSEGQWQAVVGHPITPQKRMRQVTQQIGFFFLKSDNTLTYEEKTEKWGVDERYDYDRSWDYITESGKRAGGDPAWCEEYTRSKLKELRHEFGIM